MQIKSITQPNSTTFQDLNFAAENPADNQFLKELNSASRNTTSEDQVGETQKAFRQFVGNTLYGQMLKSMRSTLDKPEYMHGGKTEEIFQQQLDQIMVEDLTKKSAATIADPMYELFNMRRAS